MVKHILFLATIVTLLGAVSPASAQKSKQGTTTSAKSDLKFLDDISVDVVPVQDQTQPSVLGTKTTTEPQFASNKKGNTTEVSSTSFSIESAHTLQFKYALLLDIEVEQIKNLSMFKLIDDWLGTRYRLGGTTKAGIDCSAFMQVLFTALYGITLPRTAKEQYQFSHRVSRTELKEGDLVFFNTKGGVSHVGMYLQNNKFVHASSSGVTISDLYDEYWSRHFIGVGRIDSIQQTSVAISTQP
jgi:lipoprotein Spr